MATLGFVTLAMLAVVGSAAVARVEEEQVMSVPMIQYKHSCNKPSNASIIPKMAALLQESNVPGAGITGIDKFKPFKTILKDGFMEIDCVKDYMYYRGDKFGDHKVDYKLGDTSEVSIVHYDAFVAKEDKVEMTQKVCFEFCRTVPNMGFFGIVNGRGCYCTPYFKPMESDSTQCESVCEGDTTLMCGGKSKSSIFSMHMCASTGDDLKEVARRASILESAMIPHYNRLEHHSEHLQDNGDKIQKMFGLVGDSGATGLAQEAKVFAGEIQKHLKATKKIAKALVGMVDSASKLSDFTDPAVVTKAERLMEDMEIEIAEGEAADAEMEKLIEVVSEDSSRAALKQYYPMMYFVDKKYEDKPSTCSGELAQKPVYGSESQCAAACDAAIHECVAYQHFDSAGGMCFLFSKLKAATYYTGCSLRPPFSVTCKAKLSKFEGTSLKVDKSGKTDFGLKKLTKADRCYK